MGNFKIPSVREKPKTELDLEDAWADEPLEESRPIVQREEAPVKKEQQKVEKLKTEAIEALANAKAEDVR